MAYSYQEVVSDGTLALLPITIEYIDKSDLSVLYDGREPGPMDPAWSWVQGQDAVQFSPAVPAGVTVRVQRESDASRIRHVFSALVGGGGNAQFNNRTMDENFQQFLLLAQEYSEKWTQISDRLDTVEAIANTAVDIANAAVDIAEGSIELIDTFSPYVYSPFNYHQNPGRFVESFTSVMANGGPENRPPLAEDAQHEIVVLPRSGRTLSLSAGGMVCMRELVLVDQQNIEVEANVAFRGGSPTVEIGFAEYNSSGNLVTTRVAQTLTLTTTQIFFPVRFRVGRIGTDVDHYVSDAVSHILPFVRLQPGTASCWVNLLAATRAPVTNAPRELLRLNSDGQLEAGALRNHDGDTAVNLFNPDTCHHGMNIGNSGGLAANPAFYTSDYIPVSVGDYYFSLGNGATRRVAAYNANKVWLATGDRAGLIEVTGDNVAFVRIAQRYDQVPVQRQMVTRGALPSRYVPDDRHRVLFNSSRDAPNGVAGLDATQRLNPNVVPTYKAIDPINLFDFRTADIGAVLNADGSLSPDESFYTSDFIPIRAGQQVAWTALPGTSRRVVGYDANHVKIVDNTYTTSYTPTLANIAFIKITNRIAQVPPERFMLVHGPTAPTHYVPALPNAVESPGNKNLPMGYAGLDSSGKVPAELLPSNVALLSGKILAGMGDSITYGFIPRNYPGYPGRLTSWLELVGQKLGADSVLNYGISGSTVAAHPTRNPMVQRVGSTDLSADVLFLMGGTNDVRNGIPLGTFGDQDPGTFYGALDTIAVTWLNRYRYDQGTTEGQRKTIVFSTPIRLLDAAAPDGLNALLPSFCDAIKRVADKYSIPCFDAYNASTLTPELFRTLQGTEPGYTDLYNPYVTDGVHPTQEGHEILSNAVCGFLKSVL